MNCSQLRLLSTTAGMLAFWWMLPHVAEASPVFARQYNVPWTVCHEMPPRLNALGEAFRLNGFRWSESNPAGEEQEGGEVPFYKKLFPKAGPGQVPDKVPLALRVIPYFTQNFRG